MITEDIYNKLKKLETHFKTVRVGYNRNLSNAERDIVKEIYDNVLHTKCPDLNCPTCQFNVVQKLMELYDGYVESVREENGKVEEAPVKEKKTQQKGNNKGKRK